MNIAKRRNNIKSLRQRHFLSSKINESKRGKSNISRVKRRCGAKELYFLYCHVGYVRNLDFLL